MADKQEYLGKSLIQHGVQNNRIYLMKLADEPDFMAKALIELAEQNGYTKIFAKVSKESLPVFEKYGFVPEAQMPAFFAGNGEVVLLAKYFNTQRAMVAQDSQNKITTILDVARGKSSLAAAPMPPGFELGLLTKDQVGEAAKLYEIVFGSYPFPIFDPNYLLETMESHIDYFCVKKDGVIVALSSAEMDLVNKNVEMTDFATLQEYRGKGLGLALLFYMEQVMREKEIALAYTIARAVSAGMNITFAKAGYQYSGTLINNTYICGRLESMNVWYKTLQ